MHSREMPAAKYPPSGWSGALGLAGTGDPTWSLFVSGFDLASQPMLLLGRDAVIRHVNPAGLLMLEGHKIIRVVGDQLHLNRRAEMAQLRHAILAIGRTPDSGDVESEQVVILRDRQDRTVMILELRGLEGPGGVGLINVNVADLLTPTGIAAAWLSRAFSFTLAEARVASALFDGLELREIAERRGLALETVRNHLKRALVKAGARSQAQLIRMMAVSTSCVNSQPRGEAGQGRVPPSRSPIRGGRHG